MEVAGDDYSVKFDEASSVIVFTGSLRLCGTKGYTEIADCLDNIIELDKEQVTIDLKALDFLNSTGITTISKFIIKTKNKGVTQLVINGNNDITWQKKTLKHLLRLMPTLTLEMG